MCTSLKTSLEISRKQAWSHLINWEVGKQSSHRFTPHNKPATAPPSLLCLSPHKLFFSLPLRAYGINTSDRLSSQPFTLASERMQIVIQRSPPPLPPSLSSLHTWSWPFFILWFSAGFTSMHCFLPWDMEKKPSYTLRLKHEQTRAHSQHNYLVARFAGGPKTS